MTATTPADQATSARKLRNNVSKATIKREKNIPLPPDMDLEDKRSKYPLETMKPGDSFSFPCTHQLETPLLHAVAAAANRFNKIHSPNARFAYRFISKENVIRVWKLKDQKP